MSFSAPSHGAGYFPFGESNQSHSRRTRWSHRRRVGSAALAPCLARAGANSHILVLKQSRLARALGVVAAASRQRGKAHFDTAIRGLRYACVKLGEGVSKKSRSAKIRGWPC